MHYVTILRTKASKTTTWGLRLRRRLMILRRILAIVICSTLMLVIKKNLILTRDKFHLIRKIRRKAVWKILSLLQIQDRKLKTLNRTRLRNKISY
jgi:hypothetical protein